MSEQRHRIKRQIVELTVRDGAQAERVQARMSQLQSRVIVPLIERICSELSAPGRVHRIESLQVDLGVLDLDDLEQELGARLGHALRTALAARIGEDDHASRPSGDSAAPAQARSRLELFAVFARTGTLPWWADPNQADCLQTSLQELLDHAPAELVRAMRDLAREPRALQRIASVYDDAMLAELFAALAGGEPSLRQVSLELLVLVQTSGAVSGVAWSRLRRMLWQCLLWVASLAIADVHALCKEALVRLATMAGIAYGSLLRGMHHGMHHGMDDGIKTSSIALRKMIEHLYGEVHGHDHARVRMGSDNGSSSPHERSGLAGGIEQTQDRARSASRGDQETLDQEVPAREGVRSSREQAEPGESTLARRPALLDSPAAEPPGLPRAVQGDHAPTLRQTREPERHADDNSRPLARDLTREDIEEIYISNSGLVILWPFLGHFLSHVGLMVDSLFKDEAAVLRAIALLQYLATEDPQPLEYLLPLNKILCGMEPAEVFEPGLPVSTEEAEECTQLLSAAIEHAPVLRTMSVPGLRSSFLLREGVLKNRDGAWLLQVERKTHDVVLDRFPWSFAWVKLPWMQAPLRVEW
jgi:hypothetical protein